MRTALIAVSAAVCLSLPAAAQRGGSANASAPRVSQAITFANGCKVTIEYRSLTWAQGNWARGLESERGRQRLNEGAKASPLGKLEANKSFSLGGKTVADGSYNLYFVVDDDKAWHLVLANDDGEELKWKLDLAEKDAMNKRLNISLLAGEEDMDARLGIDFGTMSCTVAVKGMTAAGGDSGKEAAQPAKSIR